MTIESAQTAAQLMDTIAYCYDQREGINDWFTLPLVRYFCPSNACAALEVGCGVGRIAAELANCVETVWGIDVSEQMIKYAQRRAERAGKAVMFAQGDVLTFDFGNQTFDYIYGIYVLSYFDVGAALKRLTGILHPGGRLFLFDGLGSPGTRAFHLKDAIHTYIDYIQFLRKHGLPVDLGKLVVNTFHRRRFFAGEDWRRVEQWLQANREKQMVDRWKLVKETLPGVHIQPVAGRLIYAVWDNK